MLWVPWHVLLSNSCIKQEGKRKSTVATNVFHAGFIDYKVIIILLEDYLSIFSFRGTTL